MLYTLFKHVLIGPLLRRWVRITVCTEQGRVPQHGPVIIAANHRAEIDSLILPLAAPRRLSFFAKAEYFRGRGIRGALARSFFAGTGQISVDRGGDERALDYAAALLRDGGAWGIYPEGTRSPDGRLHRGHTGLIRVAARVPGTVIVPTFLDGTGAINPPGSRRIARGHVAVTFGTPLSADELLGDGRDIRAATDAVMAAIAALGGVDYVDEYAQRAVTGRQPPASDGQRHTEFRSVEAPDRRYRAASR